MRIRPRAERHRHLDLMLLLQRRFGHVVVDPRDVRAQTQGDIWRIGQGALERGQHVGQSEQDGPDAEIRVL